MQPAVNALLFTSKTGGPVHYTGLRRSFDAACRRVGLAGVTPHSLRASCASWVADSDGVLEAVRRLGHSRSSITARHYARPLAGGDRVVADRLDRARKEARNGARTPQEPIPIWHLCGTRATRRPVERVASMSKRALLTCDDGS